jgi:hypothetical protein
MIDPIEFSFLDLCDDSRLQEISVANALHISASDSTAIFKARRPIETQPNLFGERWTLVVPANRFRGRMRPSLLRGDGAAWWIETRER